MGFEFLPRTRYGEQLNSSPYSSEFDVLELHPAIERLRGDAFGPKFLSVFSPHRSALASPFSRVNREGTGIR
jgi:hypothetical protein